MAMLSYGASFVINTLRTDDHLNCTLRFTFCLRRKELPVHYKGQLQGGSNMTGTDLCVNKPHCAAAVRP